MGIPLSGGVRGAVLTAVALALALGLTGCARTGGDAFQATLTQALPVGEQSVGQTFRPGAPRLAGFDLLTATFGQTPDPDGALVVSLIARGAGAVAGSEGAEAGNEAPDGEVIATASVDGEAVPDNGWVSVRFDEPAPVPPEPAFRVAWTGKSPVGVWANVPPPGVTGEARLLNDPYGGGQLLRGGQPATGDLAFRVVGDVGLVQPLAAVGRLSAGAVRSLVAAPAFGVAWAVLMAAALALAVIGFRGHRRRR